jgi:HEPN domain-containing protein
MNKIYINSWIDLAMKDLDASMVLFENRLYSNSFYHFQQASEKGLKAYLYLSGIFRKENDARFSGHYMLKIFKDSITKNQENISKIQEHGLDKIFEENILADYSRILANGFEEIPKKNEIFEYSGKILEEMLQILEVLKKIKIEFTNEFKEIFIEKMNLILDLIIEKDPSEAKQAKAYFEKVFLSKNEFSEYINAIKIQTEMNFKEQFHVLIIYYSNLISHNHNNLSRYPEIDFNPLKYYNLRRPIVKKLPEFTRHLKSSLIQLKKWNI